MRRTVDHDVARLLFTVGGSHARCVFRQSLCRGAKPAQRLVALAKFGPKIALGVAVTIVSSCKAVEFPVIQGSDGAIGNIEN